MDTPVSAGWLCRSKYGLNGLSDAIVVLKLGFELLLTRRAEAVEADLTVGFGDAPLGGGPALEQDLLQCWVEGAFFHFEDFAGEHVDALGDGVTVQRAGVEDAQYEHGQCSGRHAGFRHVLLRHIFHRHRLSMPMNSVKEKAKSKEICRGLEFEDAGLVTPTLAG